jgi:hypothetical protein
MCFDQNPVSDNRWEFGLGSLVLEIGFNPELCATLYDYNTKDIYYEWQPLKPDHTPINTEGSHITNIKNGFLYLGNNNSAVLKGDITEIGSQIIYSIQLEMTPNHPCPDIQNVGIIIKGEDGCSVPAESGVFMCVTPPEKGVLKGNTNSDTDSELKKTEFLFADEYVSDETKYRTYSVNPGETRKVPLFVVTKASIEGEVSADENLSQATIHGTITDNNDDKGTGDFNLEIYWHQI